MRYTLMNKNTEVLIGEYNDILKGFEKIYKIKNIEYAPVVLYNLYMKGNNK